jgi:hypothetical protein
MESRLWIVVLTRFLNPNRLPLHLKTLQARCADGVGAVKKLRLLSDFIKAPLSTEN